MHISRRSSQDRSDQTKSARVQEPAMEQFTIPLLWPDVSSCDFVPLCIIAEFIIIPVSGSGALHIGVTAAYPRQSLGMITMFNIGWLGMHGLPITSSYIETTNDNTASS